MRTATLAALLALAAPAAAQTSGPFGIPIASTAPAASTGTFYNASLGQPLDARGGPWALGEVLFFSRGRVVSDYAWRDRIRGRHGVLYTAGDLQSDAQTLLGLGAFDKVTPAVYAIPGQPTPPEFAVAVSTNQVRVVFDVLEKPKPEEVKPRLVAPASAVSGLILTPTAYRGAGKRNNPGLGLDINAAYFIGRLYAKNDYPDATERTSYLDRVGVWTLTAEGKMQVQTDAGWRPALAVGGQALYFVAPGTTITGKTQVLSDGFVVASKNFRGLRVSAGLMEGNVGDFVAKLSDKLQPTALKFFNHGLTGESVRSHTIPFASALYLLKPDYPIGVEFMKFDGSAAQPILFNFKLGRLLKLNFDLALLKYRGGYDLMGMIQFRYNHFPKN